jgi:hydrophobe/amphiphile efflux-1 (HAE1) family protein
MVARESSETASVSRPFIRRPIATSLFAVAIVVAGVLALVELPIARLPRLDFPTIVVSATLPGASPETMASSVATPLERRLGRIAGVTEITSQSSLGTTSVGIQFELDRDADAASRDVQAAINAAASELPSNLPAQPTYRRFNPTDQPILILAMTSDTLQVGTVYDAASSVLAQRIAQVSGVGQVHVVGAQAPTVRVQVDPSQAASLGIGLDQIRSVIAQQTVDQPKGALAGSVQAINIAANDQLFSAAQYRSLVLATNDRGQVVRLGDVASVIDELESKRTAAWIDGERGVVLMIRRQPGANVIETIDRIRALLPELARAISPAIKIRVAIDRARSTRSALAEEQWTLWLTIAMVVMVVLIFFRRLAATVIPGVAVPISILGTFAAMYLFGFSINHVSLMALTIATGFVVDDAIVMTENVQRLIELGKRPLDAALEGARQIGFTIASITLSLIAVFLPILFMGGVVGRFFREFSVTLCAAIAISALVSVTLTPAMCGRLLQRESQAGKAERAFDAVFRRPFDLVLSVYGLTLDWVLGHRRLMLLVSALTVGLTIGLYVVIPKGLFPQQDSGALTLFLEAPQDASYGTMFERQRQVEEIVRQDPDVETVISYLGSTSGVGGQNTGSILADLRPKPRRKTSADRVIARLRPKFALVPGVTVYAQADQDVKIGARPSRTQYQYSVRGVDLEELRTWAPKILAALKKLPALRDVASDLQVAGLEERIQIDRDTASRLGVTAQAIDEALYDAYGSRQVAVLFTELNQYRVILEAKPEFQKTPDALGSIYVRSTSGVLVPLRAFTTLKSGRTPLSITHQGQFPCVTITFNLAEGVALGPALSSVEESMQRIGLPAGLHGEFSGTSRAFRASLDSQPFLITLALLAVYIVLGVLYESYVHPITILSTLPSAGVGALLTSMLTDTEFSIISFIGIILLMGLVKRNAIMMIDFAIETERDQLLSPEAAIREACILRFRPIVMTTLTTLLGALPLAFGSGAGAELRYPLGITIVGGLLLSQILTLYTTPVVYLSLSRFASQVSAGLLHRGRSSPAQWALPASSALAPRRRPPGSSS